jgi:uncharacterized membrane protein YkvA (DUF1232 family)
MENFLNNIRRLIGKVPFLRDAVAMYFCMMDRGTPAWAKAVIMSALAYFLLPMDAIPDMTPIVGFGDDAGAIATAMKKVSDWMTRGHYQRADEFFRMNKEDE